MRKKLHMLQINIALLLSIGVCKVLGGLLEMGVVVQSDNSMKKIPAVSLPQTPPV